MLEFSAEFKFKGPAVLFQIVIADVPDTLLIYDNAHAVSSSELWYLRKLPPGEEDMISSVTAANPCTMDNAVEIVRCEKSLKSTIFGGWLAYPCNYSYSCSQTFNLHTSIIYCVSAHAGNFFQFTCIWPFAKLHPWFPRGAVQPKAGSFRVIGKL